MSENVEHKTLPLALLAAQREMDAIKKDATNAHGRFDYASAESVLRESKKVLNRHGLFMTGGKETAHDVCGMPHLATGYVLCHAASGEKMEFQRDWPVKPQGAQNPVRAAASVTTSGFSYMLRDILHIERAAKDDMNHESHDARPAPASRPPPEKLPPVNIPDMAAHARSLVHNLTDGWTGNHPKSGKPIAAPDLLSAIKAAEEGSNAKHLRGLSAFITEQINDEVPF